MRLFSKAARALEPAAPACVKSRSSMNVNSASHSSLIAVAVCCCSVLLKCVVAVCCSMQSRSSINVNFTSHSSLIDDAMRYSALLQCVAVCYSSLIEAIASACSLQLLYVTTW